MKNGPVINQLENKKREAAFQLLVNNSQSGGGGGIQDFRDGGFEIQSAKGGPL